MEELVGKISDFAISDDPLSTVTAELFITAFSPVVGTQQDALKHAKQARSSALVALATRSSSAAVAAGKSKRGDEDLPSLLTPLVRSRLADTAAPSLISALRFLSSFFSVSPTDAQAIIAADGMLDLLLEAPEACNPSSKSSADRERWVVTWSLADMLSSAANSTATRKYLSQQQNVLDWLDIHSSPQDAVRLSGGGPWWSSSEAAAVVAGLCDLKLGQALAAQANEDFTASLTSSSSQPASKEQHLEKVAAAKAERRQKDTALYGVVQHELTSTPSGVNANAEDSDLQRQVRLSCYEALTWLTTRFTFKDKLASDSTLLKAVCKGYTAPPRTQASKAAESTDADSEKYDGALQLSLATIISNVTAYKPQLSEEQQQVSRLRKFASAQGQPEDQDALDTDAKVEQRCAAVVGSQGVEMLVAIATARSRSGSATQSVSVNASKAVRDTIAKTLLALLTKQDRVMRGRVVQQGGMRALLALSVPVFHNLSTAKTNAQSSSRFGVSQSDLTPEDLVPLQGLCKIIISLDPTALFPSQDSAVAVAGMVAGVVLCEAASRLQTFEALLALTNLASISPVVAFEVARSRLPGPNQRGPDANAPVSCEGTILRWACETLVVEDHPMIKRATIELLVNINQDPSVADFLASTSADYRDKSKDKGMDRFTLRLKILLAACEPDDGADGERAGSADMSLADDAATSAATRLASLSLLATLCEKKAIARALLGFDNTVAVLLANITPSTGDTELAKTHEQAVGFGLRAAYMLHNFAMHFEMEKDTIPSGTAETVAEELSQAVTRAGGRNVVQERLQAAIRLYTASLKRWEGTEPALKSSTDGLVDMLQNIIELFRQLSN